jgi:hypothetical protein
MPTYVPGDEEAADPVFTTADASNSAANQQMILLIIMLSIYCAPIILVSFYALHLAWGSTNFTLDPTEPFSKGLIRVSGDTNRYTGLINSILVPVSAAITAANYDKVDIRGWGWSLFLVPLAGLVASLFNILLFDLILDSHDSVANMFQNTGTALSVYVMMLVGLKVVKAAGG